jgi:hypothetical protein
MLVSDRLVFKACLESAIVSVIVVLHYLSFLVANVWTPLLLVSLVSGHQIFAANDGETGTIRFSYYTFDSKACLVSWFVCAMLYLQMFLIALENSSEV